MKRIGRIGALLLVLALLLMAAVTLHSADAEAATGKWKQTAGGYQYVSSDGTYPKSAWKTIDGKKYYFNAKGYSVTGWKTIGKKKYYFSAKGVLQTGWKKIGGKKYYFSKKGVMQTGWKTIGKKRYYFSAKGVLQTGWKKIGGKKYYFDKKGVMQTGWMTDGKKRYCFDAKGVLQICLNYRFRSQKLKDQHFAKHGKEMGYQNANAYEVAANEVISDKKSLHKIESEDGDTVYYREKDNAFVVVSTDGYIRTFFNPEGGKSYYDRQ